MSVNLRMRARVTFRSEEYGKIRAGEIYWSDPGYAKDMIRLKNAVLEPLPVENKPQRTQVIPQAPQPGKEPTTESAPDPSPENQADEATGSGRARRASVLPQVRRSRKQTAIG